jgi:hypothetical protein
VAALTLVTMLGAPALAMADGGTFKARLQGFQEVPAISTEASGEFSAKLNEEETSIEYELSYEKLTGTVSQGHIHLGVAARTNWTPGSQSSTLSGPQSSILARAPGPH